jgi:hypothetical protein
MTSALLVRTRVEDDVNQVEALGSWLTRLAHANGYRCVGALCTGERLGIKHRWAFDADVSQDTLAALTRLTLCQAGTLERMTLRDTLAVLTGSPMGGWGAGATRGRWLLKAPASTNGARYGICCRCILEDGAPFLRVHWRLSTTFWCQSHRCELLDTCPHCGAAVTIGTSRTVSLGRCETCNEAFTAAPPRRAPAADEGVGAEEGEGGRIASWLAIGPSQQALADVPVAVTFPHLWWDGVRVLLELCGRPELAKKLLGAGFKGACQDALQHVARHKRIDFDSQSLKVRAGLLVAVDELTADWPYRFLDILGRSHITRSHFLLTELPVPSWLARVRDTHLDRKKYAATPAEARTAIALLRKGSDAVSKRSVKALLGVTESKALDAVSPVQKTLTLVQLGQVVERLDHAMRTARTAREEQASALRDACCVASAAWHGIGFERAANLSLDSGHAMVRSWNAHAPSCEVQAFILGRFAQWMRLYLRGVRPRFGRLGQDREALFLTRYGRPYQGFGVAALFAHCLREAGIRDWERGARLLVGPVLADELAKGRRDPAPGHLALGTLVAGN